MALRVLIIDDELDVIESLSDTLRAEGFETAGAATFEEGSGCSRHRHRQIC
jgi:DNA-binding response OmpR family regulator